MKSSSEWFTEWFTTPLEEKKTEDLVSCLESVMLNALEDNPLITLENKVCGSGFSSGFVYVIDAGQGNTIKLVEAAPPASSLKYRLLVNNVQVDGIINQDFRRDFISRVIEAYYLSLDSNNYRQTCIDVLSSWNDNI